MTSRIVGDLPAVIFRLVFSADGRYLVAGLWRGRIGSNLNLVILRFAGTIRGAGGGRSDTMASPRPLRERALNETADRLRAADFLLFRKLRNSLNRFFKKSRCNRGR